MSQMYKVFINNKPIIFTNTPQVSKNFILLDTKDLSPLQLLDKVKEITLQSSVDGLIIDMKEIEFPHREFTYLFKERIAAGGLVLNEEGRILLIRRNDMWDLPKGHQDGGESIEDCALREVEEETGVLDLTLEHELCHTFHHYILNDKDILKDTTWFLMRASSKQALQPETEEGIVKVEWVKPRKAHKRLSRSWKSLIEVLDAFDDY